MTGLAFGLVASFASGCDAGRKDDQVTEGPFVTVTGANVGSDRPLPADGTIELAFDRLLLPSSVTRQSVQLRDSSGNPFNPVVSYDPVARIVALSNPNPAGGAWLNVGQSYSLTLPAPRDTEDSDAGTGDGVRAIDRAPLDAVYKIGFSVVAGTGTTRPESKFCRDVLPVFQERCASSSCHAAPKTVTVSPRFPDGLSKPAAGLLLETSVGVVATAVGRTAQGANTGPSASTPRESGRVFGIDMPLVDPGNPGNSWLLYKLLLTPRPATPLPESVRPKCNGDTGTKPVSAAAPDTGDMGADERKRLGDVVSGQPMPYPSYASSGALVYDSALSNEELQRIRLWIAQGARVEECGACEN
ncbi:MAG: hypothetical protein U0169_12400 [Polyangiaceae bacterium]